jgi:hypothetical protein
LKIRIVGGWLRTLIFVATGACGPSVDSPPTTTEDPSSDVASDASSSGDEGTNPFGKCLPDGLVSPSQCSGSFGAVVDGACQACACHPGCEDTSDCPEPPSGGTATADCYDGRCILPCDADNDCPGDMLCGTLSIDDKRACVEVMTDALACAANADSPGWDDPCPPLATRDACEALSSPDTGYACTWVEQETFAVPADECVPAATSAKCVLTAQTDVFEGGACGGIARLAGYCANEDVRVVYEDLGPGTARLSSYRGCDRFPVYEFQASTYGFCDYSGALPIPLICECGCSAI